MKGDSAFATARQWKDLSKKNFEIHKSNDQYKDQLD